MSACDTIDDALCEGRALTPTSLAHADGCERCGALIAADRALTVMVSGAPESDGMSAALRAELAAHHAPGALFSPWQRAMIPFGLTATVAGLAALLLPRRDLSAQPVAPFAAALIGMSAVIAVGVYVVLHRGARGLGVALGWRLAYLATVLVGGGALFALSAQRDPGSSAFGSSGALHFYAHCAGIGSLAALFVGAGVLSVSRRTAVTSPAAAGAVAGAASGLAGTLFLHLACPMMTIDHLMIAHGTPVLLGAALGAAFGRRLLSP